MKIIKYINSLTFLLCLSILISSCGSDGPEPSSLIIEEIVAMDVGNSSDASDIYVRMTFSEPVSSPFKYFIIKPLSSEITIDFLKELSSDRYTISTVPSGLSLDIGLSADQVDTDGEAIQPMTNYQVLALNEEENVLSNASSTLFIRETGVVSGMYSGVWNDNIYTNFGVSARLNGAENTYSGSFFYSNDLADFTPCCGGSDDGNISITVDDSNTITEFTYDQDLPNFMGGCPGDYTGSGKVDNVITVSINFTGDDCEGPHSGRIRFERIR